MLVVMQQGATEEQVDAVIGRMVELGFNVHRSTGVLHTVLGGVGGPDEFDLESFEVMEGVKEAHRIVSPYKLASRSFRPHGTVVQAGGVAVGGEAVVMMAGPCSVESRDQIERTAALVAASGARVIRGGAFRPPGSGSGFQGLGEEGLRLLRQAADRNRLAVVSEVMDASQIPLVAAYADILQAGARNMQNFNLLRELGRQRQPVLLKRGIAATVEEWLLSADYIMAGGNYDVILCERGIRTFETYTRYTMDISAIPVVKKLSHLPVVADPSHGTGRRDKVAPMSRAAVAAGADGLLVEVHPDPDHALSEGAQSLAPEQFEELMRELKKVAAAVGEEFVGQASGLPTLPRRALMKTVTIVGTGLIGASFGLALRKAGFQGTIVGVSSERAISEAMACGAIDGGAPLADAAAQADLIFLSQTIGRILDTVRHLDPLIKPGALITDAGSTKCEITDVARQSIARGQFLGGHPMAGKEARGASAADAGLFRGRRWVLTPDERSELETPAAREFLGWIERIGARTVVLDADEHDRIVSLTSHLPQLASTALAALLSDAAHLEVAGSGLADMTRLALSSYDLWRDILATNTEYVDRALSAYIQELEHMRENLRTRQLRDEFERGSRTAARLRGGKVG